MIRKRTVLRRAAWVLLAATMPMSAACGGGGGSSAKDDDKTSTSTSTSTTTTTTTSASGSFGTVSTSTTLATADTAVDTRYVPQTSNAEVTSGPAGINGTTYSNALLMKPAYRFSGPNASLEIDAGRDFTRFRGDLGIPDDQPSSTAYDVQISLDNAAPTVSTQVRFGETKTIDLDITNVLRIKIALTSISDCCNKVGIGNPRFTR
jgi:hypothetical protein